MMLRSGKGWQTTTADLALILFLITAQAVREEPRIDDVAPSPATASAQLVAQEPTGQPLAEPASALALHRPAPGESVRDWLRAEVTDDRQVATVAIRYTPARRSAALAEGARLLAEAESAGIATRLVATPDTRDDLTIAVDFLRPGEDGTKFAP